MAQTFLPAGRALRKDENGVVFEIAGVQNGKAVTYRLAVVARRDGGFIPAALASVAAQKLLLGQLSQTGLIPIHRWISPHDLVDELRRRGLHLWRQPPDEREWRTLALNELW